MGSGMKLLKIFALYLIAIPFVGFATGLVSYSALRLTGCPESSFMLKMMLGVWGGGCIVIGVYESAKTIREIRAVQRISKEK
jgi:hypothetical protein